MRLPPFSIWSSKELERERQNAIRDAEEKRDLEERWAPLNKRLARNAERKAERRRVDEWRWLQDAEIHDEDLTHAEYIEEEWRQLNPADGSKIVKIRVEGGFRNGRATPSWYKTHLKLIDSQGKEKDVVRARKSFENLEDALHYLEFLVKNVKFRQKEEAQLQGEDEGFQGEYLDM